MFQLESIKHLFTQNLYWSNPYNVLQLPVYAKPKDIRKRKEDLEATAFCGNAQDSYSRLLPYDWKITPEVTEGLFETLKSPEPRLFYWLLWFWPMEKDGRNVDEPIQYLSQCAASDRIGGLSTWYEYYLSDGGDRDLISNHNLAVYYHMMALEQERYRLSGEDIDLPQCDKLWKSTIKHFDRLLNNDDFWEYFADRVTDLNDPQITTDMVSKLRHDLPMGLDQINAALLKEYLCKNELDDGRRQLEYIKSSQQGLDDVEGTLTELVNAMFKRFNIYRESIRKQVEGAKRTGAAVADKVLRGAARRLKCLALIAGVESPGYMRMSDEIAYLVLECQIEYAKATRDWELSVSLLRQALAFAQSTHAKKRLSQNLTIVKKNADDVKVEKFFYKWVILSEADHISDRPEDGLRLAEKLLAEAPQMLSEARLLNVGEESLNVTQFADDLALKIQNCLISYSNDSHDYEACLNLQLEAEGIAISEDVKARLREGIKVIRRNIANAKVGAFWDEIAKDLDFSVSVAKKTPAQGAQCADGLMASLEITLRTAKALTKDGATIKVDEIRDSYAAAAIACQVEFANLTEDWDATLAFLRRLKTMVNSQQMHQRIDNNIKIVRANAEKKKLHETCWICKQRTADPASDQIITMHGDISWDTDERGNRTKMKWKVVDVHVPHCKTCLASEKSKLSDLKKLISVKNKRWWSLFNGFHPFMSKEEKETEKRAISREIEEMKKQIKEIEERRLFPEIAEWLDKKYTHGPEPVQAGHFSDGTPLGWV